MQIQFAVHEVLGAEWERMPHCKILKVHTLSGPIEITLWPAKPVKDKGKPGEDDQPPPQRTAA